ncbi:C25 family cysteine peptidase, partial [candidate division KSB1 bacterium]|nr:C25 family cysteine peptidase [candidate division KSB1 bacterium]
MQIFEVNEGVQLQPVAIKAEQPLIFNVTSAGYRAGAFARIEINGKAVIDPGRRGMNVVVVDSITGRSLATQDFDTYASALASDSLARFINRITHGQYVLAAIRDEGTQNLTEAARLALESIGSRYIRQVRGRDSWAMIGYKGAAKGSVPETYRPDGAGIAVASDTVIARDPQGTYHVLFTDSVFQAKRYWVTLPQACLTPQSIVPDTTSNLTRTDLGADYLIFTHPKFTASAQRLAAYRRQKNGFRVQIVKIQDLYDEFNFGIPNPRAVKDFLKFAYNYWTPPAPTAVIFWGDASWDLKMNLASSQKSNFVPTYGNPVSDHWFVCLDGPNDLLPDLLTGRIAIETDAQGQVILDKIINYENLTPAEWQKEVLFITGGFDAWEQNKFTSQSNTLNQKYVQPAPVYGQGIMINKTTEGRFEGEKKPEILAAINPGKLWVNFLGHAGSQTWDLMFNDVDVLELTNSGKCPLVTSMTCHTARFANPDLLCFGELFVNFAERGAIAFWGTTGWGYLEQDYILLDKLFPTVLKDTVHTLGAATMQAKVHLWQRYGASLINTNTLHQYTLLGDPVLDLALSSQPELNLALENIKLNPELPVETDSLVQIKITVQNFGLATTDSVELSVIDINQEQVKTDLAPNLKLKPIGFIDSVVVNWPLHGQAGEHRLQITIDPAQKIPESQKTDNSVTLPVFVYSSLLTISKPLNFQVVNTPRTILQVNTPVKTTLETAPRYYQFELDTTATFQTSTPSTLEIPEGAVVTRWQTPELANGRTYFWRCRALAGAEIGHWITSSFNVDFAATGFQVALRHPQQLAQAVFKNTTPARGGIQLARQRLVISVQSAGYADGNLARIYLNDRLTSDGARGFNLTVIHPGNGQVQSTGQFDTWEDPTAADSLAAFINRLEAGLYVGAAIKDEGSRYLNENGYLALESIGSQYCRQIGPRDSWAIIGIKGAAIGSVPELYKPTGGGPITLNDTLLIYPPNGQVISPVLG